MATASPLLDARDRELDLVCVGSPPPLTAKLNADICLFGWDEIDRDGGSCVQVRQLFELGNKG